MIFLCSHFIFMDDEHSLLSGEPIIHTNKADKQTHRVANRDRMCGCDEAQGGLHALQSSYKPTRAGEQGGGRAADAPS